MVLGGRQEEDSGRGRGEGKATKLVTRGAKVGRGGGRDGVRLYHADRAGGTTRAGAVGRQCPSGLDNWEKVLCPEITHKASSEWATGEPREIL